MAQLDFYALNRDVELLLGFVFEETDCRVFEAYSRPGHDLREFPTLDSLLDSDFLEVNHQRYFLRLLSRAASSEPVVREFTLRATGQKRRVMESPAMFQIDQGRRLKSQPDALSWSTFSHWNEAGAKQRSSYHDDLLDSVDWKQMRRVSGRIHRYVRNKLAVAKLGTRPILPAAFEAMDDSLVLWGGPGRIDKTSPELQIL